MSSFLYSGFRLGEHTFFADFTPSLASPTRLTITHIFITYAKYRQRKSFLEGYSRKTQRPGRETEGIFSVDYDDFLSFSCISKGASSK